MKRLIIFLFVIFVFCVLTYIGTTIFTKKEYVNDVNFAFGKNDISEEIEIKDNNFFEEGTNVNKIEEEINIEKDKANDELINIGILEIPVLNLKGEIREGTSNDVIDKYIGHFECTNIWNGNVAIYAHNNGFSNNYFAKLNELKVGDDIIYSTDYGTKKYIVNEIDEIDEKDVYVLNGCNDNKLTLITCISGKPNKRLCVQAIENWR